ncbi:MAG: ATP-dependent DNA helicase [Candidatus Neomarinimicrobiota bacterium]
MVIQEIKISPNSQQRSAIEHPPAPLMILAGAGTGKTFTLENRIVYLIKEYKVDPKHLLAITYTEKAAKELKNRVIEKVGAKAHSMIVNTFHAFCYKLLRDNDFSSKQLLDESEAVHMFLTRFDELKPFESTEFPLDPQRAITESFMPFFNRMRDELIDPEKVKVSQLKDDDTLTNETRQQLSDLKRIYPLFQSWKEELNVVDYGDMILSAYQMISTNKSILKNIQDNYRHIVIDEFQDNNFALNEIVNLIAGKRNYVTAVGDDDQVIYSFRGANNFNIQAFRERYGDHEKYQSIALETNYRSNQAILDLANESIKNNPERVEKTLTSYLKAAGEKPVRFWGEKSQQLDYLINEILHLNSEGIRCKDIAVLCRTHGQATIVMDALSRSGIPTIPHYMGLLNCSGVKDIIAWCQVIADGSHQDSAMYRIIYNNLGKKFAYEIFSKFKRNDRNTRHDLIKNDKSIRQKYPKIDTILSTITKLKDAAKKKSAGEMTWMIAELLNKLKTHADSYTMDDQYQILNVGNFLKRSQDFTKRNRKNDNLRSFNKYLEAIMRSGGLPGLKPQSYRDQDGIIVNTVHGVKGAEFPIVFIPFLRSASFPLNFRSIKRINKPPDDWLNYAQNTELTQKEHHQCEERRLFYVAVTRAKQKLYLLVPKKATSPFIKELPDTLMEDHEMSAQDKNLKYHSDLKVKYETSLQKALAREDYDRVNEYSRALKVIHEHEKGNEINLGESDWEKQLKTEFKSDFQPPVPDRVHLSASAIETYESCALKFRLGRIDGIPQTANKPELVFGNIIHSVLQRYHEHGKDQSLERILRLLDEEWKENSFDYQVREEKFKEQGIEMLTRYQSNVSINPPVVVRTEEQFTFDIGPITIRGAIDRIDKTSEGITILDYKTSKTSSSAKSNLQLAIYSMYLEQLEDDEIGGLPESSMLYFLRDEEEPVRDHSFTSEEIAKTKEKILAVAAGIRKREFSAKKGKHCDWCDYKNLICPAWEQ